MALFQTHYLWRNDNGNETVTGATDFVAVNTSATVDVTTGNIQLRLRLAVEEQNASEYEVGPVPLEFNINAGGWTTLGSATTGCKYYNSANLTDGNDTTGPQIAAFTYVTTNEGVIETSGGIGAFNGDGTEYEYTVEFVATELAHGDSIDFRIPLSIIDGGWTVTGNATIEEFGSISLTGTVTGNITETQLVGKTIILTLTGDTFVAAGGVFDAQRQAILDGLNGV